MKLSIVIPAHNEEGCIERTVRILHGHLSAERIDHEILIVNDNSSDRTEEILLRLQKEIPTAFFINNSPPNGFGFAVRKGLETYTGDAVAVYMADGSDRPEDLVQFLEALEKRQVDCVFGSRFIRGAKVVDYPFLKLVLNRFANIFIQVVFGLRYNDVTNAFKLYRRHVIDGLHPFLSHHYNLTVELPLKAIVRGYTYTVVPNDWINRKTGTSKLKIQEMGSRYLFLVLYCLIEKWLSKGDYLKRRSEQPVLERKDSNAEQFKPFSVNGIIAAVFAVCLMWASLMAMVGWNNSISDLHGFRQTQTAITSYYLARGGPLLRYETPILGYPWSIPFEFPLYQLIVAGTSKFLQIPLQSSGRLMNEVFFGLSLLAMWFILSELRVRRVHRLIFITLTLVSAQYIFWSRTFMIESTALFFCMAYLYFIVRYTRTRKPLDAFLGGLCGAAGALVKLTTFPVFALVGAVLFFYGFRHDYISFKERTYLRRIFLSNLIPLVAFAILPVLINWIWVRYADQVRALNRVAAPLVTSNLWTWNFGTLAQRTSVSSWRIVLERTIPDVIGNPITLLLAFVCVLFFARHRLAPFLISILGFLAAFLIFTNLHLVHNYYAYANGIFLIAAVSWAIVGLLEGGKRRKFLGLALFLFCVFSSIESYYGRLYHHQKTNVNTFSNTASAIKNVSQPGDAVLILLKDWSSELPYYSERRALIWPKWMPPDIDGPVMKQAISRLGNYRIGAVALCDGAQTKPDVVEKAVNTFGLAGNPNFEDAKCAVYAISGRGDIGATRKPIGIPNYQSHHEFANCERVSGWVWDKNQPHDSVSVSIYDGATRLATIPANQFRQDLLDAGIGDGNHFFVYSLPERLRDGQPHSIEVKTAGTDVKLFNTPRSITCAPR